MKKETKSIQDLTKGAYYKKNDLLKLSVRSLNNRGMDYIIFEINSKIYFFEKSDEETYKLFDIKSQFAYASSF